VQLGLMDGMLNILVGILIVQLIEIAGAERVFAPIAYISAGAAAATQWTHFGMLYALADLAKRSCADAGVLALFT
jgi:hypothetical protein